MLFTKQQAKHSFIIPTGKSLGQLLTISFARTKNDTHAHTHILTLADCMRLQHCQTMCTKIKGGQINHWRLRTCVRSPVTFQRALKTHDLYFLCSATLKHKILKMGGAAMIF